jgi:PST family polysaccharide transporter
MSKKIISSIHRIVKDDLIRVFSFTAISTLVRMLTSLFSIKIVASIIGPSGVALVGQLNNFATIAMSLSNGGINSGVTKYIAEYKEDKSKVTQYLSTALRITVVCSLITGLLMILFHSFLSNYIMLSPDYGYVFVIFGCTILFYALNMLLTSIINGFKEFKRYVSISIAGSIIGLFFTVSLVYFWSLPGALISAVTFQSIMFFVTLWMVRKLPWVDIDCFREKWNNEVVKKYARYSLMAFVTAATVPVSQMLLRGYVISEISITEAGWWEGMNRISVAYLSIITTSFGVYYLPRLSEINDRLDLRHEILKAYKVIVPMLLVGFSIIYFLRYVVIHVLFTPDFLPMENLFIWQLAGDFFKMCSWLLGFLMLAKSMTKAYIFSEISFSLSFLFLGFLFMHYNNVVGIIQAYFINYIFYFIFLFFLTKKLF